MRDVRIAITAASYSGNKGAAAMLQSSVKQLYEKYGHRLNIKLMSVYPQADREQVPHDFMEIVSCKPGQLLFVAFPLAVAYRLLRWCRPIARLLRKNKIIRAYTETDLVLDEAGISFVDSRGIILNLYAFVCAAVPLLIGVPVVKYSQALGAFRSPINRFLAKWILPKISLICARGEITRQNLADLGVVENVAICADGAFTMADDEAVTETVRAVIEADDFYESDVIGISASSVVLQRCQEIKVAYENIMVGFIDYLNTRGLKVLLLANAARLGSEKPRNNDLMICDSIYQKIQNKEMVRWYHKEMTAEEIRTYISHCRCLVASRFHAMIGALEKKIPVLLIGWSHKYKEVLDMFALGQYAIDYSSLNLTELQRAFEQFRAEDGAIRKNIEENYMSVMASSRNNILRIGEVIDEVLTHSPARKELLDSRRPERYVGNYLCQRKGYAAAAAIRENAASGGVVTAFLCYLLEGKLIDGAWVVKTNFTDGELGYESYIATDRAGIMAASSSIYMDMPLLKHLDTVRSFPGKVAVVLTPCLMGALTAMMEKDAALKEKIALKIGLCCSGAHAREATLLAVEKAGVSLAGAKRFYYRRGYWRGMSAVVYRDGTEKNFSYTKTLCAYKNAYFFEKQSCMYCQDQYAATADISFGDIWLKKMKKSPIKHTGCVIRMSRAYEWYFAAVKAGAIVDCHISSSDLLLSQKRALVFKFNCARQKMAQLKQKNGLTTAQLDLDSRCRWNHRLAFRLAEKNRRFSFEKYETLRKVPMPVIYYYMCLIRVLLSF